MLYAEYTLWLVLHEGIDVLSNNPLRPLSYVNEHVYLAQLRQS